MTTDLEGVGRLPRLESMMDLSSLQQLSALRLPAMSEEEWDTFSSNSLAASLQYLMWPQPEPRSRLDEVPLQPRHAMNITCSHHKALPLPLPFVVVLLWMATVLSYPGFRAYVHMLACLGIKNALNAGQQACQAMARHQGSYRHAAQRRLGRDPKGT